MKRIFEYIRLDYHLLIIFVCGMMVYSCQDEEMVQSTLEQTGSLQVRTRVANVGELLAAKQYYLTQVPSTRMVALRDDSLVNYTPYLKGEPSWTFYASLQNDNIVAVDVDLTDRISQDYLTADNIAAYKKYKQLKFRQSYTRYVYTRNILTDEEDGFFMTIVPSVNYVRNSNKRIRYNTYLRRDNQLDGYILFHSLDGKFVNGWEYTKGELTGKILPANKVEKTARRLKLFACSADYTVELKMASPSVIQSREGGGGWDIDGGSLPDVVITPGGGGGSDPDPFPDPFPDPDPDPDPDPAPDPNPGITDPDDGDDGGYGGSGGGGTTTPVSQANFASRILTTTFCNNVLNKLRVNPKNVELIFNVDKPTANASYLDGTLTIYNRFFDSGYTQNDMESIIYHEMVHYKQDIVDHLVIDKDKAGNVINYGYWVQCTQYDVDEATNEFYEIMESWDIPLREEDRTSEQQAFWEEQWNESVQPRIYEFENGLPSFFSGNKEFIKSELDAYQSQLDEYGNKMSSDFWEQTRKNLDDYQNRWNKIKDR